MNVKNILDKKGYGFWSIDPEATVFEALQRFDEKNIGAILVVKEGKLQGIFSERDYARKIVLKGLASKDSRVKDFMTKDVISVSPDSSVVDCMSLMTEKRFRHLPVMENEIIVGVISIGDLVNSIINSQESTIKELESYIHGNTF
jgi:CBS domain-containing protein